MAKQFQRQYVRALGVALLAAVSCVSSPRSTTNISEKSEPVTFAGAFEAPDVDLELQAKNQRTGAWVRFGTARTRLTSPLLDQTGRPYFRFENNAVLPQDSDFWLAHPREGRVEAQVRVVHDGRVLTTFDADAEKCARQEHDRGLDERAIVEACAAKSSPESRIYAVTCGGLGEPCCAAASGAAGTQPATCSAAHSCEAGVCRKPGYAVPLLRGHRVDLSLPSGYQLRDAWLVIDDRESGTDSRRALVREQRAEPGVELSLAQPNLARLDFDLAFYKPGGNRFYVQARVARGDSVRTVDSEAFRFNYELPRALGLSRPRRFQLPAEHFPRRMRDCGNAFCKDADADGLNDLWENVAVQQLRPRLQLASDDGFFSSRSDIIRVLTSVTPLSRPSGEFVLFASVVAFSRDYGHLGLFDHPGDAEAFGMVYRVEADGALTWVASVAKGHPCLTCRSRFEFNEQDFAPDGTPLIYVERHKHGLWQNGRVCRARAAFSCKGDYSLRPPAFNVGDPSPDGSRSLVDSLDGIAPSGPFGELAGVFPGDAIWNAEHARVPGGFCGGNADCRSGNAATPPGALISRMLALFVSRSF